MAGMRNRKIVIKLGTGVLTHGIGELDTARMRAICAQVADALKGGWKPILVSSGAVGLGMGRLGLKSRPKKTSSVQMCAAVGQGILIQTWGELFAPFGVCVAQILLTRDDLDVRARHKAMRDLLDELLGEGIVPIINENDCISAVELNIKFGDNDVLSSLVAALSKSSKLLILSTAPGLVDIGGTGEVIPEVLKIDAGIRAQSRRDFERHGGRRNGDQDQGGGNRYELRLRGVHRKRRARRRNCRHTRGQKSGHALCRLRIRRQLQKEVACVLRQDDRQNLRGRRSRPTPYATRAARCCRRASARCPENFPRVPSSKSSTPDSGDHSGRGLAEENSEDIKESLSAARKKCGHKDVVVHRDNLAVV